MVSKNKFKDSLDRPGEPNNSLGSRYKVMILANNDPSSYNIMRAVCEDDRIEVIGLGISTSLSRHKNFLLGIIHLMKVTGLSYFLYSSFWYGVTIMKDFLIKYLPFTKHVFKKYFSLKLWAKQNYTPIMYSPDFNSREFLAIIKKLSPDLIVVRVNQIFKREIINLAPYGCWVFHSSELPKYRGAAAEFQGLLHGDETVGFTVMQMAVKVDTGLIIRQATFPIPDNISLHNLMKLNHYFAHGVIKDAISDLLNGNLNSIPQDEREKSYYSWPTPEQTREFLRKGLRYITLREAINYIFE